MAWNKYAQYNKAKKEKPYDIMFLMLDVGKTSTKSGFTDSAFKLASQLVQRQIYKETNMVFGINLFGSNDSNAISSYNDGNFTYANYDVLKYLDDQSRAEKSNRDGDWMKGMDISINQIKKHIQSFSAPVVDKKLCVFSDLKSPTAIDKFDGLIENLSKEGIEVNFFGPEWASENEEDNAEENGNNKTEEQKTNTELMYNMVTSTGGSIGDLDRCIEMFCVMDRKKKKPFPWKADLEIGPDIRINITGYINLRRESPKTWKQCLTNDNGEIEEIRPVTTFVRNNEQQDEVENDNIMESYRYGSQQITVSDADKKQQGFQPDEKSIRVIGFVAKEKMPKNKILSDGNMVFFPTEGNPHSITALPVLMQAMYQENVVALVRRVYSKNSSPKLGFLIPEEDHEKGQYLTYVEVPFMEDVRSYSFQPLSVDKISEEQLEAVDNLIDDLLVEEHEEQDDSENEKKKLSKEDKEMEKLRDLSSKRNPYYQHLYNCLTYRALHPGRLLPDPDESNPSLSMTQPKRLESKAEQSLSKIKDLFKLELLISKKNKITGDEVFGEDANEKKRKHENGDQNEDETEAKKTRQVDVTLADPVPTVDTIGTVTPVEDFKMLLEGGIQFDAVVVKMEKVIIKLLSDSLGDQFDEKIQNCIKVFRKASLERKNSGHFNNFMSELKPTLSSQKKFSLWQKLVDEKMTLISVSEDTGSTFTSGDVLDFNMTENASEAIEEDDDDLLDQL